MSATPSHGGRQQARSSADGREAVVRVVESYLNGLGRRDLSDVPFDDDVTIEGPLAPRISGRQAVVEALAGVLPIVNGVRIVQHIVEGEYCGTVFDFDTTFGVIPVFDRLRVVDGRLKDIRPFYDPSPITNAQRT
jgi:hypothetical protein